MKLVDVSEKKNKYLKAAIDELETNSKIKNIRNLYRGTSDFKKGYQPRTNVVKDEKGDLITDSYSIVAGWRNYFYQLLNGHVVKGVRQREIHSAVPLMSEPSGCETQMAIEKVQRHKPPGIDQIQENWLTQRVEKFALRSINLLILFGI